MKSGRVEYREWDGEYEKEIYRQIRLSGAVERQGIRCFSRRKRLVSYNR